MADIPAAHAARLASRKPDKLHLGGGGLQSPSYTLVLAEIDGQNQVGVRCRLYPASSLGFSGTVEM
jgi:hypothetical protein